MVDDGAQVRFFRGARRIDAPGGDHRGIAYGDGLFETMRGHAGRVHWWDRHWARLSRGCEQLRIDLPDQALALAQTEALLRRHGDGVAKLVLSRGASGRGYAPAPAPADWQLAWHRLPPRAAALTLRWCDTRLARQPLLAGLKHCNRLEQVLARAEWRLPGVDADEGVLLDDGGEVVSAIAANLFAFAQGRWTTPMVDRCGVAGVCRGWALDALDASQARLSRPVLEAAEAMFLCNAVRGILPVARLGGRHWSMHPAVVAAQARLAAVHPAFAAPDPVPPDGSPSAFPPSDFAPSRTEPI